MKLLLLALLVSSSAFAATSATLLLKGNVPRVLDIVVTPTTLASNLPLDTTQVNAQVATVTTKWNTVNGARVTVSSANAGQLKHSSVSTSLIPYTLNTAGTGTFSLASPQTFDAPIAGPQNVSVALNINYIGTASDALVEGDYSDTVTFTISAL